MAAHTLSGVLYYLRGVAAPRDGQGAADHALLEQFVAHRQEAAFEAVLQRHGPMVLAVCRRILGSAQDAEDAFQATFLVLARRAPAISKRQSLASWLHGVALRTSLKRRIQLGRRRKHERQVVPMMAVDSQPDVVWTDLRQVLDQEVERLPEKYRVPVVLCYLEGRTYDQAAQQLGCSKGTLATRLTRARGILRQALGRRGLGVTAGLFSIMLTERAAPACVPQALAASSLRAAMLFTTSPGLGAAASAPVLTLAEGVLETMSYDKLKAVMLALVAACVICGLGALGYQAFGAGSALPLPQTPLQAENKQAAAQPQTPKRDAMAAAAIQEALKAAGETKDDVARIAAFADIAAAQVKAGDKNAAAKTFDRALDDAGKLKGDKAAIALARIARAQAEAGNLQTASRKTFERAWKEGRDSERWTELHPDIAILQLEAGFNAEGWKELEDFSTRIGGVNFSNLQSKVIDFQLRTGDIKGATTTMEKMLAEPHMDSMVADALVRVGEAHLAKSESMQAKALVEKALERLATLPDVGEVPAPQFIVLQRPYGLACVAIIEAKLGEKKAALEHVKEIQTILASDKIPAEEWPQAMKVNRLAKLAEAQAALGEVDAARKTLKDAAALLRDKGDFRYWAVLSIAEAQAAMQDWSAALKTAESVGRQKGDFLQRLASAQTAAGQGQECMAWAARTDLPMLRARAYLGVARALEPAEKRGAPLR
jgi:RNA polymerase sigma factor (sigma-70 family)